ncbi:MAG TPA: response regulator transcription factor [Actinomycetota bacterium]|nr:response regulator transcription factor [Actinomycetota bacterium]
MPNGLTPEILVIEDDLANRGALVQELERERFIVRTAREGRIALEILDPDQLDLIILDTSLPDMSGFDVCREIRRRSDIPIIMISGSTSEVDTVVGLEVGADDYVVKPFRPRELLARIRVQLRRTPHEFADEPHRIVVRDVELDRDRHEVFFHGEQIRLPLKEFELLELLLANAGKVVTRQAILERVWGTRSLADTKTLDVHVKRLRKRLQDEDVTSPRIVTIRGVGYRFDAAPWSERRNRADNDPDTVTIPDLRPVGGTALEPEGA